MTAKPNRLDNHSTIMWKHLSHFGKRHFTNCIGVCHQQNHDFLIGCEFFYERPQENLELTLRRDDVE